MHDPYLSLRFPNFRFFIATKLLITLYLQIEALVVGWQLYEITHDPLALGMIGLAVVIPALSVSLLAGYVADNFPRKRIVQVCYLLYLLSILVLISFSYFKNGFISQFGTLPMYIAVSINGFARGFASPSSSSLMTDLVPKDAYFSSSSWNSTAWELGSVFGPLIGGFSYAYFGATNTYILAFFLVLAGLIFFSQINVPIVTVKQADREPILKSVTEGLRFVFNSKMLLSAITLDLFAVLFGGAVALLPVFAKDILHIDSVGLGMLRGATAVGAGLMALYLAYQPPMKQPGRNLLWAVAVFGISTICFAYSTNFYLSLACLFVLGAADSVSVIIRTTIMQMFVPAEMRGRVSSVNSMFISSSNELGAFESGVAAKFLGTVPSVVFGGFMTLLVVIGVKIFAPILLELDFQEKEKEKES
ncbi:MAG: hypothetical protein RI894_333 [Bacteroidota bacterium]|jgi:MFS family permease